MQNREITPSADNSLQELQAFANGYLGEISRLRVNLSRGNQVVAKNSIETNIIASIKAELATKNIASHFLYFFTKKIADLLLQSSHPFLKQLGQHAQSFYQSDMKGYVKDNGLFETPLISGGNPPYGSYYQFCATWNRQQHKWGHFGHITNFIGVYTYEKVFPTVKLGNITPANVTPTDIPLLTYLHIAAAIGDMVALQRFSTDLDAIRNESNALGLSPLDCAVECNQVAAAASLIEKGAKIKDRNIHTAIKLGSFPLIDLLVTKYEQVTLEMQDEAESRSNDDLNQFIEISRKYFLTKLISVCKARGALPALKEILAKPQVNRQEIANFLVIYPNVLSMADANDKSNTIFHHAALQPDSEKMKALVEGREVAKLRLDNVAFDAETVNAENQTVLKLLLTNPNASIDPAIEAFILFAKPNISPDQDEALKKRGINPDAIRRKNERLVDGKLTALDQRYLKFKRELQATNERIGVICNRAASKEEVHVLQNQLADAEEKIDELSLECTSLRQENCVLKQQSRVMEQKLENNQRKMTEMEQRLEEMQRKMEEMQQMILQSRPQIANSTVESTAVVGRPQSEISPNPSTLFGQQSKRSSAASSSSPLPLPSTP